MCQHGDTVPVLVRMPPDLSHTGRWESTLKPIDRCISPIVEALQQTGIDTRGSCCGHGERPGEIVLQDGRVLIVTDSRAQLSAGRD